MAQEKTMLRRVCASLPCGLDEQTRRAMNSHVGGEEKYATGAGMDRKGETRCCARQSLLGQRPAGNVFMDEAGHQPIELPAVRVTCPRDINSVNFLPRR